MIPLLIDRDEEQARRPGKAGNKVPFHTLLLLGAKKMGGKTVFLSRRGQKLKLYSSIEREEGELEENQSNSP